MMMVILNSRQVTTVFKLGSITSNRSVILIADGILWSNCEDKEKKIKLSIGFPLKRSGQAKNLLFNYDDNKIVIKLQIWIFHQLLCIFPNSFLSMNSHLLGWDVPRLKLN